MHLQFELIKFCSIAQSAVANMAGAPAQPTCSQTMWILTPLDTDTFASQPHRSTGPKLVPFYQAVRVPPPPPLSFTRTPVGPPPGVAAASAEHDDCRQSLPPLSDEDLIQWGLPATAADAMQMDCTQEETFWSLLMRPGGFNA